MATKSKAKPKKILKSRGVDKRFIVKFLKTTHEELDSVIVNFTDENNPEFYIEYASSVFWETFRTYEKAKITPDNINDLVQAHKDCPGHGTLLFLARQLKTRPTGRVYNFILDEHWPLFDAAGPERSLDDSENSPKPKHSIWHYTQDTNDSRPGTTEDSESPEREVQSDGWCWLRKIYSVIKQSWNSVWNW